MLDNSKDIFDKKLVFCIRRRENVNILDILF